MMPPMHRNVPSGTFFSVQAVVSDFARGNDQQKRAKQRSQHGSQYKGQQSAGKAEPRCQHGHQLGIAQADALAAANQPVEPADKQDKAGGGEDFQQPYTKTNPKLRLLFQRFLEHGHRPDQNAKPNAIPGNVTASAIQKCSASRTAIPTSSQRKNVVPIKGIRPMCGGTIPC